uniref:Uncharacterized protein n=1 Tax=Oryza glumipatula TaxID=40148 RepID=A0A0D9ZA80_9ORYZ
MRGKGSHRTQGDDANSARRTSSCGYSQNERQTEGWHKGCGAGGFAKAGGVDISGGIRHILASCIINVVNTGRREKASLGGVAK